MSENTTTQPQRTRATLVLDDGSAFPGFIFGATPAENEVAGEVAFTTDMFGYERELCEAERAGQILVFATPQVGNVGWTGEGASGSTGITATAVIVRDLARIASNHNAQRTLAEELESQGITGLWGVDTRKLVRHLAAAAREGKSVRGQVTVEKHTA
ncbi:carbamoyl-phosphate synthase domain-containing protein [Corynebacterium lehmanniae]